MVSAYVEVIVGVGLGLIVGVVPAVAAALVGAAVPGLRDKRYVRMGLAVAALPVAAGLVYVLGVVATQVDQVPRALAGGVVVVLLTVYGFEQGTRVDSLLRRDGNDPVERGRPLSAEAIAAVDASGQVTIRPAGQIRSVAGYPALPPDLEATIGDERWRLPADLPLSQLEDRIERQLERAYDLEAVEVTVDSRGTASVAAAPPVGGIAHRVPEDCRAVSIDTSIPDRVAPGDEVLLEAQGGLIEGFVLSAVGPTPTTAAADDRVAFESNGENGDAPGAEVDASTNGIAGSCRLTVAVPTAVADALLKEPTVPVAVSSRDTSPDFHALSLLDRAGQVVRMTTLDADLQTVIADDHDSVGVFAARPPAAESADDWTFDPTIDGLAPGWDVVVVGDEDRLADVVRASPTVAGVIEA